MRARAPHRRALIAALGVALLTAAALAPEAMAGAFSPESGGGSPNAGDISTLYEITLYIAIVIFVGVEGALIWSLVRFRARRDGPPALQVHGNTPLELGWTFGAALIVVALAVITFIYLDDIEEPVRSGPDVADLESVEYASIDQPDPPGGEGLTIAVNGQQYLWRYDYVDEEPLTEARPVFAYHEMVVPVDTTVVLRIRASDVIHSWWIPELGGKADAVPGHTNETWFKIEEPGTYDGACTELCGAGHADMRARVRAVPVEEYEQWVEQQRSDILAAQDALAESREARRASGESF